MSTDEEARAEALRAFHRLTDQVLATAGRATGEVVDRKSHHEAHRRARADIAAVRGLLAAGPDLPNACTRGLAMTGQETTHMVDPPSMGEPAVTRCCGFSVSKLPPTDSLTWNEEIVTCPSYWSGSARVKPLPVGWLMPGSLGNDARAVPVWEWPDGTLRLTKPSPEGEA